jgi:hypothetical protein
VFDKGEITSLEQEKKELHLVSFTLQQRYLKALRVAFCATWFK